MRRQQVNARWVKSSFSFANGNCVEVAELPGDTVGIRDGRDPGGPVLRFTRAEWAAFLSRADGSGGRPLPLIFDQHDAPDRPYGGLGDPGGVAKPAHGYDLKGLIESERQPQAVKPDRLVHRITPAGRAELDRWLNEPNVRTRGYRALRRQRVHLLTELRSLAEAKAAAAGSPVIALLVKAAGLHVRADLGVVLPAEAVELPVSDAAQKGVPLIRRKPQDGPRGVPAVANADLAPRQARYLDAVTVGVAQRALDPVRA
jgi:uncharacterized protein DUF397